MANIILLSSCKTVHTVDLSASELFDFRTKCTGIAADFEKEYRQKATDRLAQPFFFNISNHYSASQNRCYVEVTGQNGPVLESQYFREIWDAQERKAVAECAQTHRINAPPIMHCTVSGSTIDWATGNERMNLLMDEPKDRLK